MRKIGFIHTLSALIVALTMAVGCNLTDVKEGAIFVIEHKEQITNAVGVATDAYRMIREAADDIFSDTVDEEIRAAIKLDPAGAATVEAVATALAEDVGDGVFVTLADVRAAAMEKIPPDLTGEKQQVWRSLINSLYGRIKEEAGRHDLPDQEVHINVKGLLLRVAQIARE